MSVSIHLSVFTHNHY